MANISVPLPKQPVQRAAAQRTSGQRFYNKASGRMETAQQMHAYHAPAAPANHPANHVVTNTQHTVTRETSNRPAQAPSLIQMTPSQIEARARSIVNSEVAAERQPFQSRAAQLPKEEAAQQSGHEAAYNKLASTLGGLRVSQGESAKTFQNQAAEAVKRAEQTPGATQTAASGGSQTQAVKEQEAASRGLLQAIASGSQSGTNARQQSEANFLTNIQASSAQEGAAGQRAIAGEYGKREQEVADREAQLGMTKTGRVGKLVSGLEGEQEKLRIAEQGLGIKGLEAERHAAETRSDIRNRQETQAVNRGKLRNSERATGVSERKVAADEKYRAASQGTKELKDSLDIKQKELAIKKALEGNPHKGTLTALQINTYSGEMSRAFNFFKRAREEGATPADIRKELEMGQGRRKYETKNSKTGQSEVKRYTERFTAVKNPVFLQAAEEIMQKEYIGAATKQQLREMGLPDSGWSNKLLAGRGPAPQSYKPERTKH